MTTQVTASSPFLDEFKNWADKKRESLLSEQPSENYGHMPSHADVMQSPVFWRDLKYNIETFSVQFKYEATSLTQCVATLAAVSLAVIVDLYRASRGSINASTCLWNIVTIPKHIILSIFSTISFIARTMNKLVNGASAAIGFLTWHSGEWLVRIINKSSYTVLSNYLKIRNIVYNSLGLTVLAGASVFIPIATIQMMALPIILGSLYGTLNNQFTVRECPEYYTMGHYYDGKELKGHAIKTNNILIKPIITGCYATIMVTKIAGIVLALIGTFPYTAAALSVTYGAWMIAGVCLISLVTAHIFSRKTKEVVQKNLDAYASLIGIQWTEDNSNKTWDELAKARNWQILKKRMALCLNSQELQKFNKRLQELTESIESDIIDPKMPVNYIAKWQANNTRNGVGYTFAGAGTVVIAITSVFLRIFVLH